MDRPLPGVLPARGTESAEVCVDLSGGLPEPVRLARAADWVRSRDLETDDQEEAQTWTLSVGGHSYLRLRYQLEDQHAEFVLDPCGTKVWAGGSEGVAFDDVASYLLGPVLGCLLRLRGVPCLHASVVGIGECALAILGSKGAGKSTTAAGLAALGHAVLSDDIAVLTREGESFYVQPGYSRLRLWKPAIDEFYGSRDELPRVLSIRNKRYFDLASDRFQADPLPLAALYVLGPRSPSVRSPSITALSPAQGLMAFSTNSYAQQFVAGESRAREFTFFGELAQRVPVRQLERPDEMGTVRALCRAIQDDFARL